MKILLAARDPGAAANIIPVAQCALASARFDVSMYAAGPAYSIIKEAGLPVHCFHSPPSVPSKKPSIKKLLKEADAVLNITNPDAVLTGLSGPDAGIDEALLLRAKRPLTFAIQDFWGDVNTVLGKKASLYFVMDKEAATLSRSLHGVDTFVSGLPKYEKYKNLNPVSACRKIRTGLGLKKGGTLICIFGQPLWQVKGYEQTLKALAKAVAQMGTEAYVFYRPHPKEGAGHISKASKIFSAVKTHFNIALKWQTEEWLAASDVVCTPYSSCAYDQILINRLSSQPLGTVVYLLFDRSLIDWYRHYTGIDYLPPVKQKLAFSADNGKDLRDIIEHALKPSVKIEMWKRIKKLVPLPGKSADAILKVIYKKLV